MMRVLFVNDSLDRSEYLLAYALHSALLYYANTPQIAYFHGSALFLPTYFSDPNTAFDSPAST